MKRSESEEYSDNLDNFEVDDNWSKHVTKRSHAQLLDAVSDEAKTLTTPYGFHNLFMVKIWLLLAFETNRYAYQRQATNWINMGIEEIQKCLGLYLKWVK